MIRVVGTLLDVTDERNAQERMLQDSVHDNLTGLPNRELYSDRLESALVLARTQKEIRPAVILIDLDRFKQINEQVGVAMGDSILLTVAHRLTRVLQPQDTLARLRGDTFAIILISNTQPDYVATLADSVRKSLSTPVRFTDREIALLLQLGSLYTISRSIRVLKI